MLTTLRYAGLLVALFAGILFVGALIALTSLKNRLHESETLLR